uniref:Uncharacterized protein n=1 Tax=Pundamilia nyererei TaxID=303518 RepID=A0A3B4H7B6_9CICH
ARPQCSVRYWSTRLESVGEDDELFVANGTSAFEMVEKPGRRKHSLPQQLDPSGVRQEYQIIKKSARSLSTVQVESPWRLAQPSIISSIVLMKGQGKVSALIWHVYMNKALIRMTSQCHCCISWWCGSVNRCLLHSWRTA